MNTLANMYKLFHFNLTMSPLYLVKLKITQKQPTAHAVYSVELIVPDFRRKSFNVRFLPYLFDNSFSSLLAENLWHSFLTGSIKNLSSNSIWLILTCKLQLNCREFWCVIVMTSSNYWVSKVHVIVEYSFLFSLVKNGENRWRNAKVIVENKVSLFYQTRCSLKK